MQPLKYGIILILLFSLFYIGYGQEPVLEDPVEFVSPRMAALGGLHPALTDDVMTIFSNPAGFVNEKPQLLLAGVTVGLTGPIFDITGALIQILNEGEFEENFDQLVPIIIGTYAGVDVLGPLAFAYTGNGLSFGIFEWVDVSFNHNGGLNIDRSVNANVLLTGGYAFRIPLAATSLDIGFQLKALLRGANSLTLSLDNLLGILRLDFGNMIMSIGGGIDMGILYSIGDVVSIGITVRNVYTPTMRNYYGSIGDFIAGLAPTNQETGLVPLDLSGGIKITPNLGYFGNVISGFKILLDYDDILDFLLHPDTARHWFLHLGAGLEFSLLEKLALRAGFSQGLFSAGIGLDLTIFSINAAMFGSEISSFPGLRPAYNLIIGFDFKI